MACPRCGDPVPVGGRGRPRIWCSDNCRRRGAEEGIRVQEHVRERVVERQVFVPHNPISAVELVLTDTDAVRLLFQELAYRLRGTPQTDLERAQRRHLQTLAPDVSRLVFALWGVLPEDVARRHLPASEVTKEPPWRVDPNVPAVDLGALFGAPPAADATAPRHTPPPSRAASKPKPGQRPNRKQRRRRR